MHKIFPYFDHLKYPHKDIRLISPKNGLRILENWGLVKEQVKITKNTLTLVHHYGQQN